jgi:hypothetical protein
MKIIKNIILRYNSIDYYMSTFIVKKADFSYHFTNYNININLDSVITWLENNNPIYSRLEKSLLSKDYTGIIKIYENNILYMEIKIFEGSFFRIKNFKEKLSCYIEDDKIPLEIRENNKINKINVQYIYDNYVITTKPNDLFDIYYQDTMERDSFNLKNVKLNQISENQFNIYKKFTKIIKETKEKVNSYVDSIDI